MRPIEKYVIGQQICLDDGSSHTVNAEYKPYREAKLPLCANFGKVCVYCEAAYSYIRDLHVEHILPKAEGLGFEHLQHSWDNFLLSCATCNGIDNKGDKICPPADCHYPHLNNTFMSFKYAAGGVVMVNPLLKGLSATRAEALIKLLGLDKTPLTSRPGDTRWHARKIAWDLALRYRRKYESGKIDASDIIEIIKGRGFWSIWYTVFQGIDEVRQKMITEFPGTAANCFDAANHYEPVPRNPHLEDPV